MSSIERRVAKLEAEKRAAGDSWLAQRISAGLGRPMASALAALGQPHQHGVDMSGQWQTCISPPLMTKRRYRPRGTWKKLRRCKCR